MRLDEPSWWYDSRRLVPRLVLSPLGVAWGLVAELRFASGSRYRSSKPVICVGNFTAGGTGKTPVAIALAGLLRGLGCAPAFLSRGYGGSAVSPRWVDPEIDVATIVGDEALLLARSGPALISKNRRSGAIEIENHVPSVGAIVMDDGLQTNSLLKDLSLAVVDHRRGLGNGCIIPAGPLRSPLARQLARVDAIIALRSAFDNDPVDSQKFLASIDLQVPVFSGISMPSENTAWLKGTRVLAFCGIGAPNRFLRLLSDLGANIVKSFTFPDHHMYSEIDAHRLLQLAKSTSATLVTTEKDWVRLAGGIGVFAELRSKSRTLPIIVMFPEDNYTKLRSLIAQTIAKR